MTATSPSASSSTPEDGRHLGAAPPLPSLSIVVPALNERETLARLVARVQAVFEGECDYELLLVDDGSDDGSAEEIARLRAEAPRLRAFSHVERAGKTPALLTGVLRAQHPLIATMDADLQNDAADVLSMLKAWHSASQSGNPGLVAGQRRKRQDNIVKKISSRTANHVRKILLHDETRDTGCGLKLMPRDVFLRLPYFTGMHRFFPALVRRLGYEIVLIDVDDFPRAAGVSKYGFWNRLWVGIGDMLAVWWLIRRGRMPGAVQEITERV